MIKTLDGAERRPWREDAQRHSEMFVVEDDSPKTNKEGKKRINPLGMLFRGVGSLLKGRDKKSSDEAQTEGGVEVTSLGDGSFRSAFVFRDGLSVRDVKSRLEGFSGSDFYFRIDVPNFADKKFRLNNEEWLSGNRFIYLVGEQTKETEKVFVVTNKDKVEPYKPGSHIVQKEPQFPVRPSKLPR